MRGNTKKITLGAMMLAIFALILLLNRQTGGLFTAAFIFILPLPMAAYGLMYGRQAGLAVWLGMCFMSVLFGTFTTIFYACTQSLLGYIFGVMLYKKVESGKIMMTVMSLSSVIEVLNLVFSAFLFGYNIADDAGELQAMITEAFQKAPNMNEKTMAMLQQMLTPSYLKQLIVICTLISGLIQGFLIYEITILVLRRLRFQIKRPKSLYFFFPPKWLAFASWVGFMYYAFKAVNPFEDEAKQAAVQVLGGCAEMYLIVFAVIGGFLFVKVMAPGMKTLGNVFVILAVLTMPMFMLMFGLVYAGTGFHKKLLETGGLVDPDAAAGTGGGTS